MAMKRTILFRGYSPELKKWAEGDLLQNGSITHISNFDNGANREHYEVLPETVGQYIGEDDKANRKIFEGQKVKTNEADWIGTVVFEYGMFMVKDEAGGYSTHLEWDKCEVIEDDKLGYFSTDDVEFIIE